MTEDYLYKDRKIYHVDASMTIELSLLMPAIMMILVFIIFASYYEHDRCAVEHSCYSCALRRSEGFDISEQDILDEIEKSLIGKWDMNVDMFEGGGIVVVKAEGIMKYNSFLFFGFLRKKIFSINITSSVNIIDECKYLNVR